MSEIRDPSLWKSGKMKIDWVRANMPLLRSIREEFEKTRPFEGLRQVAHALLTRPPLSHKIFNSEENQIRCFVRLACVKHAASVHPEPGSNSR